MEHHTRVSFYRNITNSYIQEAIKPIPHLERPKRAMNFATTGSRSEPDESPSDHHKISKNQNVKETGRSENMATSAKTNYKYTKHHQTTRVRTSAVTRCHHISLHPCRPVSAQQSQPNRRLSSLRMRQRAMSAAGVDTRRRPLSAGVDIQFRCLEQIDEDNNQHVTSGQRMSGSQIYHHPDQQPIKSGPCADNSLKQPKSAKQVNRV